MKIEKRKKPNECAINDIFPLKSRFLKQNNSYKRFISLLNEFIIFKSLNL